MMRRQNSAFRENALAAIPLTISVSEVTSVNTKNVGCDTIYNGHISQVIILSVMCSFFVALVSALLTN